MDPTGWSWLDPRVDHGWIHGWTMAGSTDNLGKREVICLSWHVRLLHVNVPPAIYPVGYTTDRPLPSPYPTHGGRYTV